MGTITDKLNKLTGTKAAIRAAITNKGQAVADDDTFATYAEKVARIQTGVSNEAFEQSLLLVQNQSATITIDNKYSAAMAAVINGENLFQQHPALKTFEVAMPSITNAIGMFTLCTSLTSFTSLMPNLANGTAMFYGCSNLTTFSADLSSLSSANNMFYGCSKLSNINLQGILNVGLDLSVSIKFTQTALVNILNALADLTGQSSKRLTVGAINLAKLTAEHKAIATNKNWVLA